MVTGCTQYETNLSKQNNIYLEFVRKVDDTKVYCIGKDKQNNIVHEFSGYYFLTELKKIS